ncbi:MAG: zinc ribbon domain-containing protein [Actinomycetota bacterium]|nr:zinc ribbon domain-containing protein [Actinomycetota bacterium]MDD5667202.1 zinc ribbon domain-containing protein [Actinomycetota bacterium]
MEQLNPGQIRKHIKQLKQREQEYFYYLGQLAFQAGEQGKLDDPGMLEAYRVLKDIQVQIPQWEVSLEQLKAAKQAAQKPSCPQCGEPVVRGAAFCAGCGTSLAAPPPQAAGVPGIAGMACPTCGGPLEEDAVFCGNCGARTGLTTPESAAAPAPPPSAAPPPAVAEETQPPPEETHACPKCGAVSTEAGIQFCSVCGASLQQAEAETQPPEAEETQPPLEETHACPKCGAGIPDKDMVFCSACGTKVKE